MINDQLAKKERDLDIHIAKEMDKKNTELDKGMRKVMEIGVQKQKQLDSDLRAIKEVCAKFFGQYDSVIDKVISSNHKMELQYENWSKVLIEPEVNRFA